LVGLTAPQTAPARLKQALAQPAFQTQAVVALKNTQEAPVGLAADRQQLASSGLLLEATLKVARTAANHAFSVPALTKKLIPELHQPFHEAVNRRLDAGSLPPTVGWVLKKDRLLFLMEDLNGGRPSTKVAPRLPAGLPPEDLPAVGEASPPPPPGFAQAFDEAFDRLDRLNGAHNIVRLLDLRRALPVRREVFDAELRQLRRAGRYSLVDAEGRHGISPEERGAAIAEEGAMFLYVSRKAP
jgi:hypothetical protein